ncbi:MAG: hypothetical protein ACI8T1_001238 [Verrucomicrobiales bacterium]|jgi:hypothetical protein
MNYQTITITFIAIMLAAHARAQTDPVLWLNFDGNVEDQSGSGNDGTILNDAEFGTDVPAALVGGSSLILGRDDAENQGVTVAGTEDLSSDEFTLAYWINPAGPQGNAGLERLTSRGGDLFETAIGDRNAVGGGDPLTLSYYAGSWETTEITVPENEWTHIAWRNKDDGDLDLLINGENVFTGIGVSSGHIGEDALLNIGTRHNEVEGFEGLMDDLRHYNVALTDEEILALVTPAPSLPPFVGVWAFDGDASDGSGNGNDGELVDAEFSDDTPRGDGGKSLLLGGGSHVLVPHSESLNIIDAITIAAWVKPEGEIEWDGVIGKNPSDGSGDNHAGNYELRIENGDRFLHFLHQQGGADDTAFHHGTESIIAPDIWTHIAVTAETESGDVNFYINGSLSQTLEGIITIDEFPTNENPLFIGSRADLFTPFDGLLDEVVLHNAVLDETEIENLFNNGLRPPGDSDGDGMSNDWEETFGFDPDDPADAALDADGDTLTNLAEFTLRTNPNEKDTDMDGLDDSVETKTEVWVSATDTGTNPARPDTDRDGLLDGVETNTGTYVSASDTGSDPHKKDTDGDGAADGLEVPNFDPNDPSSVPSIQLKGGTFAIRHVDSSVTVDSRDATEALLAGDEDADEGDLTVQRAFVNFVDDVAAGFVDSAEAYPLWGPDGNSEGGPHRAASGGGGPNHEDFAIEVTGSFFIQAPGGTVTIGINSDDGFVLWIDGEEIGEAGNRGRTDSLMTVELTSGQHELRMIQWERGGGAGGNMFIGRGFGEITSFNEGDFELLNAFAIDEAPLEGDDSDSDNMADLWENFYFGDLSHVGTEDGDADGLDDLGEYANKGNPTVKDTDGDGLEDGPEVNTHNTSPKLVDSDGDSLGDGDEVTAGTDPAKTDTDGDSFDDNVEKALATNPTDPNSKPTAITQVSDGLWSAPETWSSNAVPAAGNDYVAVGTVTSTLTSADGDFGGDSLTLVGPDLALDLAHSGDAIVNLTLNNAAVNSTATNSLGGTLELKGSVSINAGDNTLSLASPLTGAAILNFQGGSTDSAAGNIELTGESNHASLLNITGTDVAGFAVGSLGTGSITLANGGVAFGYEYNNPTALIKIQGAEFRMVFAANVTVADVIGIDTDGNQLFSLFELLGGAGPYAAADILAAFGLDQGVSGDGMLTLAGNTGDTDIDGLQDAWETANFGNLDADPAGDPDADGLINLAEEAGGTDPNDGGDGGGGGGGDGGEVDDLLPSLENVGFDAAGAFGVTIPEGITADIEYSTDLQNWQVIATEVTGTVNETDAGRMAAPAGYYRAKQ